MGRKIPGKKHKGVKDPEKQRAVRLKSIKNKINAPPANADVQDVPKSLQRLIDYKERLKGNVPTPPKIKNNQSSLSSNKDTSVKPKVKRLARPKEPTPVFKKLEGETNKAFLKRVNEMVETVLKEAAFEDKYGVQVKRNYETGDVEEVVKRPKDELEQLVKEARRTKKKKKGSAEPRLTKSQKKAKKIALKKEQKALTKPEGFESYKDTVKFGDIVHEPPSLIAPKKVNKLNCAPRPGKKDLLLKSMLTSTENKPKVQFPTSDKKKTVFQKISSTGEIDKKGKRKDLPVGVRRQLERQRDEVVNAYKNLKAKRNNMTL